MSIRSELEGRLKDWAVSQIPRLPIAYEATPLTKPTTGMFLQPFLLPAMTQNPTVDANRTRELGIFHVNCWAKEGEGLYKLEALADEIVKLFPILPKVGSVSIERTPSKHQPMYDSGWVIIPVVIYYRREGVVE